jgi:hypothetical protein
MKILTLEKIKLGDDYSIIRVTYKTMFGTKDRDVIRHNIGWKWADTDEFCHNDLTLDKFNDSTAQKYLLNKNK